MKSEKRRRTAMVSVRCAPAELAMIQAVSRDMPLSGWLRGLALAGHEVVPAFPAATVNGTGHGGPSATSLTIQVPQVAS